MNNFNFTKNQIALFISVALHFIAMLLYPVVDLPKFVLIPIIVLWAIVDLVLVYRVGGSLVHKKSK